MPLRIERQAPSRNAGIRSRRAAAVRARTAASAKARVIRLITPKIASPVAQRRVAALEVTAVVLGDLHVEERARQREVRPSGTLRKSDRRAGQRCQRCAAGCASRQPRRPTPSGDQSGSRSSWSWTPVNVASPAGADSSCRRTGRGVGMRHASGSATQRRSRNERSTALITSCTHAPSSKLPSLAGPSLRISSMKLAIRLA